MNILTVENLSKAFGLKILFNNISFGIAEGDKIGVIGVNGTGKSTLLKVVAGVETADSGKITTMNGIKVGYLPQSPVFEEDTTVLKQVFKSENEAMKTIMEYEEAIFIAENSPNDEKLIKKISELSDKIDKLNAWGLESEAKTILTKLGITEFNKKVSELSGGQRKRVAMAGALISPVDLLILDEPTNHIDNETVEWLENHLKKCTKALLMVTHDRYFLDRVANKTIELDKGNLYTYQGNYSEFLKLKAEREELAQAGERKRQNFLRTELEWVRRGAQARSTKQKARLERFNEINSQKAPELKQNVEISVGTSRLGRKTIEINDISKGYNGKEYIKDFSYIVLKNDRIGIVGSNGMGKSTLLNIMTGRLKPDSGNVEIGETVKLGIFAQENDEMDENKRVIDYIKDVAEFIDTGDGKLSASKMLERFLFNPELQYSPISKLSGGEKRRLYLLKVLMSAPNILFLDEPTNDLDIETLTILEAYLDNFNGAVITVSHDRYFLDKIADRIFAFEGNGIIKKYEGGYSDYIELKENAQNIKFKAEKEDSKPQKTWDKGERKLKMTYQEQKDFETIADDIEKTESLIEEIDKKIEKCATDFVKLQELTDEKNKNEEKLEQLMDRWVYLSELNEKIEAQKNS